MSDTDEMTLSTELRELRECAAGLAMPAPPRLEAITARGRARRWHRHSAVAVLSVVGATAATALALGLTGALGPAPAPDTIRTAAFTILSNSDGTATLTINPKEIFDPATLQRDLAQDGIPAVVTAGSFCSSDPAPAGFAQVVSQPDRQFTVQEPDGQSPTITIDSAAMPAGSELSFGNFQLSTGQQAAFITLVDASSYTCTSTAPSAWLTSPGSSPSDAAGFEFGGPAGP